MIKKLGLLTLVTLTFHTYSQSNRLARITAQYAAQVSLIGQLQKEHENIIKKFCDHIEDKNKMTGYFQTGICQYEEHPLSKRDAALETLKDLKKLKDKVTLGKITQKILSEDEKGLYKKLADEIAENIKSVEKFL